jgi:G:T/U-mismatch repair DNA glycosylase
MNTNFNNDFWMMAMVADVVTRRTNKAIERTNQLLEKIRKQGLSPAERAAEDAAVKAAQERGAAQEIAIFKVGTVVVAVLIAICLFVSQWN